MYDKGSDKKIEIKVGEEDNETKISIKSTNGLGYFFTLRDKIIEAYTTSLGRKQSCDAKSILKQYNINLLNYCPI